ncbi:MAG: hypothetical protein VW338_12175, partial [Rhodospirillaceae bacterium]
MCDGGHRRQAERGEAAEPAADEAPNGAERQHKRERVTVDHVHVEPTRIEHEAGYGGSRDRNDHRPMEQPERQIPDLAAGR